MADTITIRTDDETEHALDVLTHGGVSRSAAIRQAVLETASRRERAAQMRREILRMDLGQPDGLNVADELFRSREITRARDGEVAERAEEIGRIVDRVLLA